MHAMRNTSGIQKTSSNYILTRVDKALDFIFNISINVYMWGNILLINHIWLFIGWKKIFFLNVDISWNYYISFQEDFGLGLSIINKKMTAPKQNHTLISSGQKCQKKKKKKKSLSA